MSMERKVDCGVLDITSSAWAAVVRCPLMKMPNAVTVASHETFHGSLL